MQASSFAGTGPVFAVLNPVAGHNNPSSTRQVLEQHFAALDWPLEFYETTGQDQLAEIVRAAVRRGARLCLAAGGDGTVSAVAAGLIGTNVPLGILPLGTGNVLARELNLPLSLESALHLITGTHQIRHLDAMRAWGRIFLLNVSTGISALAMGDMRPAEKRRFGRLAYVWKGLRRILGAQPYRFTITIDGRPLRARASEVAIPNASTMGLAPLNWGDHINVDDGHVDVCIIRARNLVDYARLAWHAVLHQQRRDPAFRSIVAQRSIVIAAKNQIPVQGDGEVIGQTPVHIEVLPRAVSVIAPARAPAATLPIIGLLRRPRL